MLKEDFSCIETRKLVGSKLNFIVIKEASLVIFQ